MPPKAQDTSEEASKDAPATAPVSRGKELNPHQRGIIVGMFYGGLTAAEITRKTGHSSSAVRSTLAQADKRPDGKSLPRSGAPPKYDDRARRKMIQSLKNAPDLTYEARRKATGLTMSNSYISRLAIAEGLSPKTRKPQSPRAKVAKPKATDKTKKTTVTTDTVATSTE